MMHIPVSVIIPMYNKEHYIEKTLVSIMQQSSKPTEVLVVDDCSTDHSTEIVLRMSALYPEIRLIIQEKNGGVSRARNRGLSEAKCEYVTFIDADDFYYNPDKLSNEYSLLKEKESMGINACIYSKVKRVDILGNEIKAREQKKSQYLQGEIFFPLLEWINFATVPRDYIVKKSYVEQVGGYDITRSQYEDLDLVYKLARQIQFFCTFEYGTAYRITETGLSSSNGDILTRNREGVIKKNMLYITDKQQKLIARKRKIRKIIYRVKSAIYNMINSVKRN